MIIFKSFKHFLYAAHGRVVNVKVVRTNETLQTVEFTPLLLSILLLEAQTYSAQLLNVLTIIRNVEVLIPFASTLTLHNTCYN